MISVTDLTTYLFCPRKLYLTKVLKVTQPPKERTLKGTIQHAVFERVGKNDAQIIASLTKATFLSELEAVYRRVHYTTLRDVLRLFDKDIERAGLSSMTLFQELWPLLLAEAQEKAQTILRLAQERDAYGTELWERLPKGTPEIRIASETLGLRGVIDRVEDNVPIEIKTGKAPREGVWPEHRIQIGAYMLLLAENRGIAVQEGFVEYTAIGERRKVVMNPFLKDEIVELRDGATSTLTSSQLPSKVTDERKCAQCAVRERCYSLEEGKAL